MLKGLDCYSNKWEYPAGIILFKVRNGNNRTMCEICSKLTLKTPERCYQRFSGVFIVKFDGVEQINPSCLTRLNPFIASATFLYLLKTTENLTVLWCFQGVLKGCIRNKWIKGCRGAFRNLSNIYDEVSWVKSQRLLVVNSFHKKSSIIDPSQGPKYTSGWPPCSVSFSVENVIA